MVSYEEFIGIKFDFSEYKEKIPVVGNRDIFWLYHRVVQNLFNSINIKSLLELGPWDGGVFRMICQCKYKPEFYTMVDSWGEQFLGVSTKDYSHIDKIAEEFNYTNKLDKITGDSKEVLPQLIQEGRKYELVLVDGDHNMEGQYKDIHNGWKLVSDKGLMIVDDVHSPHLRHVYKIVMDFYKDNYHEAFLIRDINIPQHPGCFIFMKNP